MAELTILHTSDMHGRLSAAAADRLAQLKAQHGAILLDSGDALPLPNIIALPWRFAIGVRMGQAGHDAACLGNREYFFRSFGLRWAARSFPCPLVATNLTVPSSAGIQQHLVLPSPAGPVAVLGLARQMVVNGSWLAWSSDVTWVEPAEALADAVPRLRDQVQWIVVLSHLGQRDDLDLAARGGDWDVLLGGHDHVLTPRGVLGLGKPVVQSGYWGQWATIVTLAREQGKVDARVRAVRLP